LSETGALRFVDLETARASRGLRLAVITTVPNLWSDAARGMVAAKELDCLAVDFDPRDEAVARWTGCPNAPVALYGDPRAARPAAGARGRPVFLRVAPERPGFLLGCRAGPALLPLPDSIRPIAPLLRPALEHLDDELANAITPALREHRDRIAPRWLALPRPSTA
jgi:hypothetical protein